MPRLRRGFKSEVNALVTSTRAELGLDVRAPLDVWQLAAQLGIPLVAISAYRVVEPEAVRFLMKIESGSFSAVTVFCGPRRLIVFNDGHARTRQASDLAHELAHALLHHTPHTAIDERGCRYWSAEYEEEANWLGGALLVPEEAALLVVRRRISLAEAARDYGVSVRMMQYRLNVTAANRRA